jgi:hypothetical protein
LGTGSQWGDNELRYSLRSLEQIQFDRVFVIGHNPSFLTNVIHIPYKDTNNRPEYNTMAKICHACKGTDISDDFLLMNDDFYVVRPMHEYPYYYDGTLSQAANVRSRSSDYRQTIDNTIMAIGDGLFFEIHGPILLNKELFPLVMEQFDWTHKEYLKRSLYCNILEKEGVEMKDVKDIDLKTLEAPFFSSGTRLGYGHLKKYLDTMYCEPCRFEIDNL